MAECSPHITEGMFLLQGLNRLLNKQGEVVDYNGRVLASILLHNPGSIFHILGLGVLHIWEAEVADYGQ